MKKTNYRHLKKKSRETRTLHSPLSQSEEDSKSQEFLSQIISFPKCVWIRWKDAATHGGPEWVYAEDAMRYCQASPPIMNTIGFVMHETDEFIYELEQEIEKTSRSFKLGNKSQEHNLIDSLKIASRKFAKEKTGKKPFTNINLIKI